MAGRSGVLGFVGWAIITSLTIISLMVTIRNGIGPEDIALAGGGIFGFFKAVGNFLFTGNAVRKTIPPSQTRLEDIQ